MFFLNFWLIIVLFHPILNLVSSNHLTLPSDSMIFNCSASFAIQLSVQMKGEKNDTLSSFDLFPYSWGYFDFKKLVCVLFYL